jgi:hypothetical protein
MYIPLGIIILLWLACCAVIYYEMRKPPEEFGRFMTRIPGQSPSKVFLIERLWTHARSGTLRVGDAAPDFTLQKIDKSGRIKLSELNQKQPVVLIFGSYT